MPAKLMCKLKDSDKKKYEELIKVSKPLLEKILELIDEDLKKLDEEDEDFSKASWAYEAAFKKGLKKGLTRLRKYVIIEA